MLILSRRRAEKVLFPELGITIEVVRVLNRTVRLGIDAPADIRVIRSELQPTLGLDADDSSSNPKAARPPQNATHRMPEMQKCLDESTLAIRLAQNQIRQRLNDNAEDALEHALASLQKLQANVDGKTGLQSSTNSVQESRSHYRTHACATTLATADCHSVATDDSHEPWSWSPQVDFVGTSGGIKLVD